MLTDRVIRAALPGEKKYCLSDGNGLVLEVRASGKKYWVSRTWKNGRERRKHLGPYPEITLKQAREENILWRRSADAERTRQLTFAELADEWMERRLEVSEGHLRTITLRLEKYLLPSLGNMAASDVTPRDVLAACRLAEDSGFAETAHRLRGIVGQIFRYGVAAGLVETDPSAALRGALRPAREKPYPTITDPDRRRALLIGISEYPQPTMRCALQFSLLTFVRPGEVRHAEWDEFDGDTWEIPASKMKTKRPHVVPLARQTLAVLKTLRLLTVDSRYLFPSARDKNRPMSDGGVRTAIRAMGFGKDEFTAHSFRSFASTVLNENGWPPDVIERQLAHEDANRIRAAYNRAEYMDQRREMMQWWADWCDGMIAGFSSLSR